MVLAGGTLGAAPPEQVPVQEPIYQHGAVAADHPLASLAGLEMLKQGGNVVDAAVATSFALAVVRPASCGLGGGGFMVIWNAQTKQAVALDYRERAPAAAARDTYLKAVKANPQNPHPSRDGALAVAVPGHVAGLCHALGKYGTLDLPTVLAPALKYCREGVPVDPHDRSVQQATLKQLAKNPKQGGERSALIKHYLNAGQPWKPNDRFYSPLGPVLERIAKNGRSGFHEGEVAAALVRAVGEGGGIITKEDLKQIRPVERPVLRGRYRGQDILTMPPPSSGGIALLEMLNVLAEWDAAHPNQPTAKGQPDQVELLQVLTEAMKHAYADRAEFLGDSDFVNVPIARLTSRDYARTLAQRIDLNTTQPLKSYGQTAPLKDAGTSHYSVMDHHGNAVACTETINTTFGSLFVEPEFGIVLNNEMDDFAAIPGEPNAFGLIQSAANAVEPGKKPLSSMTPTIVLEDGKAVLALGASGGPRIISSTLQVFLNVSQFGMSPRQAVARPRIHHQWLPNVLAMEDPLFERMQAPMKQRGHEVMRQNNLAVVQAILRTPAGLKAASDPRKHGAPAGY